MGSLVCASMQRVLFCIWHKTKGQRKVINQSKGTNWAFLWRMKRKLMSNSRQWMKSSKTQKQHLVQVLRKKQVHFGTKCSVWKFCKWLNCIVFKCFNKVSRIFTHSNGPHTESSHYDKKSATNEWQSPITSEWLLVNIITNPRKTLQSIKNTTIWWRTGSGLFPSSKKPKESTKRKQHLMMLQEGSMLHNKPS